MTIRWLRRPRLDISFGREPKILLPCGVPALVAYVAAMMGIGLLGLSDMLGEANRLQAGVLTLQLPADTSAARTEMALAVLRQTPGITGARLVEPAEQFRYVVADLPVPRSGDAQWQGDVVAHAELVDQPEILEDDADTPPQRGSGGAVQRRYIAVEQRQTTTRGTLRQGHDAQEGCLADAARPGQEAEIAGRQGQRYVVQQLGAVIPPLADMFEPDHRPLRRRRSPGRRRSRSPKPQIDTPPANSSRRRACYL